MQCQHFTWRVFRRSKGRFYAEYRSLPKGIDKRRSLGTPDLEKALGVLRLLDQEVAEELGLAEHRPERGALPMARGVKAYLDSKETEMSTGAFSESSMKKYRPVLEAFEAYCSEARIKYWEQMTRDVLQRFLASAVKPTSRSAKTRNGKGRIVHGVLRFLVEDARLVDRDCLFKFREDRVEPAQRHSYSVAEVRAMLDRAKSTPKFEWMYLPILMLATTGMRRSEAAALDWGDIDLETGFVCIIHESPTPNKGTRRTTKGKRTRRVPLTDQLMEALREHPEPRTGPVLLSPRGYRLNPDNFLAAFKRDIRDPIASQFPSRNGEPGFADATLHSFRHYANNAARRAGWPEELRLEVFGHEDEKTHQIYMHIDDEELAEAARSLPPI